MNMQMLSQSTEKSMTSLEIAELVGSNHADVRRSIERLAEKGVIRNPPLANLEKINNLGLVIQVKAYVFTGEQGKLDSITVVAQLCPQFTALLVQRWYELEQQIQQFNPANLSRLDILQLALEAEKENIALKQHIAVIEPKAQALEKLTHIGEDLGFRESAKVLKVNQGKLMKFLIENKWIYRDMKDKPQAYQSILDKGYLIHVYSSPQQTVHGERVFSQVKITAKGVAKLAEMMEEVV